MNKKTFLAVIVLAILAFGAWTLFFKNQNKSENNKTEGKTSQSESYINFNGDYSFRVPTGYIIDDSSIPGAQVILKKDQKLEIKAIDEIYGQGALAVQSFSPILTDETAFKNYLNNILKGSIESGLNGQSSITFGKKGKVDTATIKTTSGGKLIRMQYIINNEKPAVVASGEDNADFQTIVSSLDTASNKGKEYGLVKNTTLTLISLIKNRMDEDVYRLSDSAFRDKTSLDQLRGIFGQTSLAIESAITITGGVLADDEFTATLLVTKQAGKSGDRAQKALGSIKLKRQGDQWNLAGVTLPTNEAFSSEANS